MNSSQKGVATGWNDRDREIKHKRERESERKRGGEKVGGGGKKVARTPVARQRLSISVSPHVLEAFAYTGCILVTSRSLSCRFMHSYNHSERSHWIYKVLRKYFDKIFRQLF